ncbi:MAG TPA: methionyl-tRNA formyltransferase [Bacteroidales bacterium]|jgi:methionyl-tRNA formyltransferase|nr:methionyl-tRNA formyltransferase [Bacteroidales bacterium]
MNKINLRIIYMGTPDFAVEPLKLLVENNYNVVGVVTNPDKPAGRGQKLQESAVKKYAISQNLNILQPHKFRDESFLNELKELNADLQIVVAFKMLPEVVWNMPRIGTFNLHASLLPQYRGAAPINWAIINGESKTGVTTFFLKHEIDTGNIIFQEEVQILEDDDAGSIHDKLMYKGANLVLKTVDSILTGNYPQLNQNILVEAGTLIKHAPKIFKDDCKINWNKDLNSIHNHIRGLSPYPAAWTEMVNNEEEIQIKIFKSEKESGNHNFTTGKIISDQKTHLKVAVKGGFVHLKELQLAGKKRLRVEDFLRGFQEINEYNFSTKV